MTATRFGAAIGFLALSLLTSELSYSDECLKIASDPKSVRASKLFQPSVKKVFETAEVCADFVTFPIRRIQESIALGSIDGEFFRVNNYIRAMSKHVIAIPTPAISSYGLIITRADSDFKPQSLKDVGKRRIGILHGYKWHEILGKNIKNAAKSNKYQFLIKMLQAKRIDGVLIEDFTLNRLQEAGILKKEAIYKSPSIIDLSVYILLNKKHRKLLGKLDNALKKVIASGGFSLGTAK